MAACQRPAAAIAGASSSSNPCAAAASAPTCAWITAAASATLAPPCPASHSRCLGSIGRVVRPAAAATAIAAHAPTRSPLANRTQASTSASSARARSGTAPASAATAAACPSVSSSAHARQPRTQAGAPGSAASAASRARAAGQSVAITSCTAAMARIVASTLSPALVTTSPMIWRASTSRARSRSGRASRPAAWYSSVASTCPSSRCSSARPRARARWYASRRATSVALRRLSTSSIGGRPSSGRVSTPPCRAMGASVRSRSSGRIGAGSRLGPGATTCGAAPHPARPTITRSHRAPITDRTYLDPSALVACAAARVRLPRGVRQRTGQAGAPRNRQATFSPATWPGRTAGVRSLALALALLLGVGAGSGCVVVRAHQRENLARRSMTQDRDAGEARFGQHQTGSREGADGGTGEPGGGCGCN